MKTHLRPTDWLRRAAVACALAVTACVAAPVVARAQSTPAVRPNVLMICIDDLNDWVNCLGGYRGTVHTPNIDRLATRGRLFANAHTPFTMCGPARNAIMLGRSPWNTGFYVNGHPWKPNLPDAVPMQAHFKANGYHVAGAGKIYHQGPAYNVPEIWSEYHDFDRTVKFVPDDGPFNGIDRAKHKLYPSMDWGPLEELHPSMPDHETVAWAVEFLGRKHDQPFFMTAGLFLPHIPWYAPKAFFDRYPLEGVQLPEVPSDDLDDLPDAAVAKRHQGGQPDLRSIDAAGQRREAVRAYLACITYVDHMAGQILSALEASPYADNTVVVLWSDHGFHLGEKNWWHKFTLWERSTHVPFIIAGPGVEQSGTRTDRPVSLIDQYRTLIELCGLPTRDDVEGVSLVPLLRDPAAPRAEPAVTTYGHGDYAVRSERWRYIRYKDGSEELYDHDADPNEWTNLAGDARFAGVKRELGEWVPAKTAPLAKVEHRTHAYDRPTRLWTAKTPTTAPAAASTAPTVAPDPVAGGARPVEIKAEATAWSGRSVLATPDGTWERFSAEATPGGADAMRLVHTTSSDHGLTWSDPTPLRDLPGKGWGGMAAVATPAGDVHVFVTKGRTVGAGKVPAVERFIDIWHLKSSEGRTKWSEPKPVFEGYVGAISNGVRLTSGRIVLPFGMMIGGRPAAPPNGRHELTCIYSDDDGQTWRMSPARLTSPVPPDYNGSGEGACEPAIVQLKDGRVWMLMRTAAGFLYESWSDDGANWSEAKPSRFHSSTGPPYLIRLKDDRIALFWNNCEMPPKHNGKGVYAGRDALHAAIGDPTATTWRGFREIYRDPTRHTSPPRKGDRGTAYPDAVLMTDGRVAVSSGQGGRRALMWVDPAWLYKTRQSNDFSSGLDEWHCYKFFGEAEGWWRDRTQGATLVDHPDKPGAKALHVRRPDDKNPDGAVWNFPMGRRGTLALRVKLAKDSAGGSVALGDRYFDPDNDAGERQAMFLLPIASDGQVGGKASLEPGKWQTILLAWDREKGTCDVSVDGKLAATLKQQAETANGVSYLRLRSAARDIDPNGFLVESVAAEVNDAAHQRVVAGE